MAVLQHWRVTPTDLVDISLGGHTRPAANFGFRRVFRCCVQPDVPPALGNALLEASHPPAAALPVTPAPGLICSANMHVSILCSGTGKQDNNPLARCAAIPMRLQ